VTSTDRDAHSRNLYQSRNLHRMERSSIYSMFHKTLGLPDSTLAPSSVVKSRRLIDEQIVPHSVNILTRKLSYRLRELPQRWPRDASYISVSWKCSSVR